MRFYVPEWDDAVDADYDFEHDELSSLDRQERNLDYIWDIFDQETTPIDGVLISREQVEETIRKAERLAQYGVYDDPVLDLPEWLPTISDCGAWGYKSLPFPPYGNAEMLTFYSDLDVDVGVTIDHLVLGSGKDKGRLYLDKRAFHDDFTEDDIPDALVDVVDLMIEEWRGPWPSYVAEYDPTLWTKTRVEKSDHERDQVERIRIESGSEVQLQLKSEEDEWVQVDTDTELTLSVTAANAGTLQIGTTEGIDFDPAADTAEAEVAVTVDSGREVLLQSDSDVTITLQPATEVTLRTTAEPAVTPFSEDVFRGDIDDILNRLVRDHRAVYRANDKEFRHTLTLHNAREMYELYQEGDYPFRLMVAIQGWDPDSYVHAAKDVLDIGYDYLGIGGVAGSPLHEVRKIVKNVGKTVTTFERENNTRIDSHVFGFAKTEGFETIGRSGMTSFDSASMLRSAWTGGENYRLNHDERYDAIRVRPAKYDDLNDAVEKSLRGRETLVALRAYAAEEPITDALRDWHRKAEPVLTATRGYLRDHRHDDQYDASRLQDIESAFREDFDYARELQASFSEKLRRRLVKLLREDTPADPTPFEEYAKLLDFAEREFEAFPRMTTVLEETDLQTPYDRIWTVVREYATWAEDDELLEEYERTLQNRPWEKCDCPICATHGVEVCIFRRNDRNRRRGFHNTRRFYDEFAGELPKLLIGTRGTAALNGYETIEEYLQDKHPEFWQQTRDLPVAEVGVLDADGIWESWSEAPPRVSLSPDRMADALGEQAKRYQTIFLHTPDGTIDKQVVDSVEQNNCTIQMFQDPETLRQRVLEACGRDYVAGDDFLPHMPEIDVNNGLDILIIDQCSGSKDTPANAPVFSEQDLDAATLEELLDRPNVPATAARDLYTGRQQNHIKDAVQRLVTDGHNVTRYFISAGFGLVASDERLPPYDITFNSMRVNEIRERSARLDIKTDVKQVLTETEYDIVFFTLGSDYYTSIDIDRMIQEVPPNRIGVVFNRDIVNDQFENIVSIPARTEDAKEHGTIVIGLKGLYLHNFARYLGTVSELTPERVEKLCRSVEEEPPQTVFEKY